MQINLLAGSLLESGCSNLYLRKRGDDIIAVPLLGAKSPGNHIINENTYEVRGEFCGVSFSCRLLLADEDSSWLWDVQLANTGNEKLELDLLYVQDVGMACAEGNDKNEFYISQYVDHTALKHNKHGHIVCCRQNEHYSDSVPWLALGSISKSNSFSTDGLQFFGPDYRNSGIPQCLSVSELPGLCQQELTVAALQEEPFILEPGQERSLGFFGIFREDHAAPTTSDDIRIIDSRLGELKGLSCKLWSDECGQEPIKSLFSEASLFSSDDLTENEIDSLFGVERRHSEFFKGELLSFFCGEDRHIVLRRKELLTDRPHGHIMKTGTNLTPDEMNMSFSAYMFGVFQSHTAQGNVNFNRFLTLNTNPLNMIRHTGQRIFVRQNGEYYQLSVPSAFEISLNSCRWIYKQGDMLFEVISLAEPDSPEIMLKLQVLKGQEIEWLISNNLTSEHGWAVESDDENQGVRVLKFLPDEDSQLAGMFPDGSFDVQIETPEFVRRTGSDELLFVDGKSRGLSFFVIDLVATKQFVMRTCGRLLPQAELVAEANDPFCIHNCRVESPLAAASSGLNEIMEILPWFTQNAKIHYLAPHGLEQYGGAAWGTRDICQGPLEMLLSLEHYSHARNLLSIVFSNQNTDGNWPQWWMFDGYSSIRNSESHGDVIFWPILALSEYIRASNDYDFLDEKLPFYEDGHTPTERVSVIEHIFRAVACIRSTRFIDGTSLANYSDGDWNDAMQPANQEFKKRLISSWTVGLSYQAFRGFADVCRKTKHIEIADEIEKLCDAIQNDFNRFLIKDGVAAGFGLVGLKDTTDLLLHPSDPITGIHYRLLPMIRGIISGIFTPEQAKLHTAIIEKYLKGPDGARLMDRPIEYNGGLQNYFKRAESCPFFGREIGLMYTHAHLRYAEAMARLGYAEAFIKALWQVVPIGIQEIIPQANMRQSNCYYSSSDAAFANRNEVNKHYEDIASGKITFNGGWRIYSSGPGMFVKFVMSHLLGVRHSYGCTVFDPVLPKEFDGLAAQMEFRGCDVKFVYCVSGNGKGVSRIEINGVDFEFTREANPYRTGGAAIKDSILIAALNKKCNTVKIYT
ncbi:MAG: hypothetical protein K8S56_04805 [Candidatus Cloacimonetes bacterium]|nr:hypothetical protein [Candidatus Cloacimonadota bacterium]